MSVLVERVGAGPALAAVGARTVEFVTTLVFLPGLHGDAQTWSPVIDALPGRSSATALVGCVKECGQFLGDF